MIDRRRFLQAATAGVAASGLPSFALGAPDDPLFEISLVESSFSKSYEEKKFDHLDFARTTKNELGIAAIEYVSGFFGSRAHDDKYLEAMSMRAAEHEVRQLLIMVDNQGHVADADPRQRKLVLQKHRAWIDIAKALGCHSIQINPTSSGDATEQQKRAIDSISTLCEYAGKQKISVLLGNYGGVSAVVGWVTSVVNAVNQPCCGILPQVSPKMTDQDYDELAKLVPLSKGITVITSDIDENGQQKGVGLPLALKSILAAGYRGYIGVCFMGKASDEIDGIRASKSRLERIRSAM